jgi:dipeptidyl aminopeptidase/acylaminoacyl peptidase
VHTVARRPFRPEDGLRLRTASDPDLSPDERRAAVVVAEAEAEHDRLATSIWMLELDGSSPPRRFSDGPSDRHPRFSPDGRYLAYIAVSDDRPEHAHIRLARLDGGSPQRLGELPGPVSQLAWSPDSRRLAVVCRVGVPDLATASATDRNSGRLVRGLAARLDGVGWQDGRRHLFLVEVEDGSARQLTHGDFDHGDPAFSPDGTAVACASDRSPARDDLQFRSALWLIPIRGGRARRLSDAGGRVAWPAFSPDGSLVAYAGSERFSWNEDSHLFVVPTAGGPPQRVAPATDRGVTLFPGVPAPHCWTGERELAVLLADRGSVRLHRARLGEPEAKPLHGDDLQADGLAARPGGRTSVLTASWADRPSECYAADLRHAGRAGNARAAAPGRGAPAGREAPAGELRQLTRFNEALLDEVRLAVVERSTITRPDGTEVEYFTLLPPRPSGRRLPLHLEIHGGPHGMWPSGRAIGLHQALAGAGYAVVLPNPRGSTGYGGSFTSACTGDWGGGDYEDLLACCDDLVRRGVADSSRLSVSGASYGGFMTSWMVGHTRRFRAATAIAAVTDMTNQALAADIWDFAVFNMGGTPWQRPDEYTKRSTISYLPDVTTPVLVMHWEGDLRVPISQGEELYTGLRVLGKETEMVRDPGGFHIARTPSQTVDCTRRVIDWNARHDGESDPTGRLRPGSRTSATNPRRLRRPRP